MNSPLEPIQVVSIKEACINKLEGLILSGELKIGEKLPSERELSERLKVSRPVLHDALLDLASKGLVKIIPRRGIYINDFRTQGSVTVLSSLLTFRDGELGEGMQEGLIGMRTTMEMETARLAAQYRTDEHLAEMERILNLEQVGINGPKAELIELDFLFHQQIAIASGNLIYPLLINSFKSVYTTLTGSFFNLSNQHTREKTFDFHRRLLAAIRSQDAQVAGFIMGEMLNFGNQHLKRRN